MVPKGKNSLPAISNPISLFIWHKTLLKFSQISINFWKMQFYISLKSSWSQRSLKFTKGYFCVWYLNLILAGILKITFVLVLHFVPLFILWGILTYVVLRQKWMIYFPKCWPLRCCWKKSFRIKLLHTVNFIEWHFIITSLAFWVDISSI